MKKSIQGCISELVHTMLHGDSRTGQKKKGMVEVIANQIPVKNRY